MRGVFIQLVLFLHQITIPVDHVYVIVYCLQSCISMHAVPIAIYLYTLCVPPTTERAFCVRNVFLDMVQLPTLLTYLYHPSSARQKSWGVHAILDCSNFSRKYKYRII